MCKICYSLGMEVEIKIQSVSLKGNINIPSEARGLIVFAHGSEKSREVKRNIFLVDEFNKEGYATLLLDLLTENEDSWPINSFEIELLTERLIGVTKWCVENEKTKKLKMGYFCTSTGSAAALSAAAYWGTKIFAVVSYEGRPDLAMEELDLIEAPVMLIVDGSNKEIIDLNRKAYVKIGCVKKMEIVVNTPSLFTEKSAIEKVAELARKWFDKFLLDESVKERVTSIRKE